MAQNASEVRIWFTVIFHAIDWVFKALQFSPAGSWAAQLVKHILGVMKPWCDEGLHTQLAIRLRDERCLSLTLGSMQETPLLRDPQSLVPSNQP